MPPEDWGHHWRYVNPVDVQGPAHWSPFQDAKGCVSQPLGERRAGHDLFERCATTVVAQNDPHGSKMHFSW